MNAEEGTDESAVMITPSGPEGEAFRLRSYQAEMVEESLKSNIIVVMDTGSGKTHIALARTAAELETCHPDKLVWFLSPTVALCHQQARLFESSLPTFGVQDLAGRVDIEKWSDQSTWDAVFENVRIVVSTPQVLLEALEHGFMKMKRLALIIFDEAHHCTQNHPANKILREFYKPLLNKGASIGLPRILGLSASPVMKAAASGVDLQKIEANMNAIAKTPKLHRTDLLRYVHRPELLRIDYPLATASQPPFLKALRNELVNYDLEKDPYVMHLLAERDQGQDVAKELQKVAMKHSTYCIEQLKTLLSRTDAAFEELGSSAAEWYLRQCVAQFNTMLGAEQQYSAWTAVEKQEKQHLWTIFQRLPITKDSWSPGDIIQNLSPKVHALINLLVRGTQSSVTGLVFIEQRGWVAILSEIFAVHPKIQGKFKFGTFLGESQNSKRKIYISSNVEPHNQQETLENFRAGEIDLILATSVLEEGIDVSNCDLVICFERPKNLKSFIQRRGRARKQQSKYYIFLPLGPANTRTVEKWESLEEEMKKAYLNDQRQLQAASEREQVQEQSDRVYRVESTGALLTLENASQHLHHFCSTVTSKEYVDPRPQFDIEDSQGNGVSAKVTLPLSVDATIRTANSLETWRTTRMAIKDACFMAYISLHKAGLVNDNLLPTKEEADYLAAQFQIPDNTPSLVNVHEVHKPWLVVDFHLQKAPVALFRTLVELQRPGQATLFVLLLTPMDLPEIPHLKLHWNRSTQCSVAYYPLGSVLFSDMYIDIARKITSKLLRTISPGRMSHDSDFVCLFVPSDSSGTLFSCDELSTWDNATTGSVLAPDMMRSNSDMLTWGLMSVHGDSRYYLPQSINLDLQTTTESVVQAVRFPKRRDFLHPIQSQDQQNGAYNAIEKLAASKCVVSKLPASYAVFGLFAPSIMHNFETYMIANTLRTSILAPVSFEPDHLPLILQALTASSTGEEMNYQRLEFLGDCILKYIASVHLMAENPTWPESHLTGKKGKIVSNGFAARSSMSLGLDRFIISKRFTGAKWKPPCLSSAQAAADNADAKKRNLSSKIMADVVESLIGAAYVVGGFPKAFACIQTLLPLERWTPLDEGTAALFDAVPSASNITSLSNLETLIGYTFEKKTLLLQALTHPAYRGAGAMECATYERLEFLGDAVLDCIISTRLYAHTPALSHSTMHGIRTAMANASFLTYRMFETSFTLPSPSLPATPKSTSPPTPSSHNHPPQPAPRQLTLAHHIRFSNQQLAILRRQSSASHAQNRSAIAAALARDARFPWHLFSQTESHKFMSDIVESVLGAVYVDSCGDMEACEDVVRVFGILGALERILRDGVDCFHPKERLGVLAVERDVKYVRVANVAGNEGGKGNGEDKAAAAAAAAAAWRIQVRVGGVDVGGVVEGARRLDAETVAAWKACEILEKQLGRKKDGSVDVGVGVDDASAELSVGRVKGGKILTNDGEEDDEEEEEEEDVWHDAEEGDIDLPTADEAAGV